MANILHNLSDTDLADEYGALKTQEDAIGERLKLIKGELITRDARDVEGARFTISIKSQVSRRIDTKRLKADLGEAIIAEYENETSSDVVRVKPTVVFGQVAA